MRLLNQSSLTSLCVSTLLLLLPALSIQFPYHSTRTFVCPMVFGSGGSKTIMFAFVARRSFPHLIPFLFVRASCLVRRSISLVHCVYSRSVMESRSTLSAGTAQLHRSIVIAVTDPIFTLFRLCSLRRAVPEIRACSARTACFAVGSPVARAIVAVAGDLIMFKEFSEVGHELGVDTVQRSAGRRWESPQ